MQQNLANQICELKKLWSASWSTKENTRKAFDKLKCLGDVAVRRGKEILACPVGSSDWQHFMSISQAAKSLDISSASISRCCQGKLAITAGWEIKFVEDRVDSADAN